MSFAFSPLASRALTAFALVLAFSGVALPNKSFTVKPAQPWVLTVVSSVEPGAAPAPTGVSSTKILDDRQIKVSDGAVDRYYHFVRRVDNSSGLDDLSQLRFYFEPSYQQLTIHFVRIQRGGVVINALKPSEIKIIQQENELDQQLYNGSLAALIFVNDIRVGDLVDYAYTITGENPVLGGRFADNFYLADKQPIQEIIVRLVFPNKRSLFIKNNNSELQPTKQVLSEDTEYRWSLKNVNAVISDDSTPGWFDPYPSVSLSEFQTWAEVVQWALPFYRSVANSDELRAKVKQFQSISDLPEQRAIAALRFIQDEIRYLGIELGRYSHQPTQPERVFARRFGDCKDKSLLLTAMLVAMGIEAAPALVNTKARSSIESWQPSPFAFDHVIVQAKISGKTYWLDPTISYQRGGLEKYYDPPFERGLVLRAGKTGLDRIPRPPTNAGSIDVLEVYNGEAPQAPVLLTVTTTYQGSDADEMRYQLSISSLADLSKSYLNFYAATSPSIRAEGLPLVEDDQKTNTLVIKERYSIAELWKDNHHSFLADKISSELEKPRVSQRAMPLGVRYPLSIKQTILINLGAGYDFPSARNTIADDALRFEYQYSRNGNQLRMDCSLQTFADSIAVDKVQKHLSVLDKAQNAVGFELNRQPTAFIAYTNDNPPRVLEWLAGIVILGIVVFLIVLFRTRLKRRKLTQFVQAVRSRPGSAPETALRLSTNEQLEAALANYNCRCGQRPYDSDSPPKRERFTYDGQRLLGIRLMCPACRQVSDLYVNLLLEDESGGLTNLSTS